MPYNIRPLHFHKVKQNHSYIFDSNIWLSVLSPDVYGKTNKAYIKLFEKVIKNDTSKIVLSSIQASEIFNRLLRDVFMKKHAEQKKIPKSNLYTPGYFKRKYRPTDHCKRAYETIVDDIQIYEDSIIHENDVFDDSDDWCTFLDQVSKGLDFNDFLFYEHALKKQYSIVTEDGDFWLEGVEIITANKELIAKQNAYSLSQREERPAAE